MSQDTVHVSVMTKEVLEGIKSNEGGVFLDCTLGGGGHTQAILESNPGNKVVATDRDMRAINRAKIKLTSFQDRVSLHHAKFSGISKVVGDTKFDGVVADLGISTDQLKEGRGFSFKDETLLDMRMDESQSFKAIDIVNEVGEVELFKYLKEGGVGQEARLVAKAIVRNRPFESAAQLAEVVNKTVRVIKRDNDKNPSTVVFQALRMVVNDELNEIDSLLNSLPGMVKSKGRVAIISFHSLEDKSVARMFRFWEQGEAKPASWPGAKDNRILGRLINKKAVLPSDAEMENNSSSRSARLRIFEFN